MLKQADLRILLIGVNQGKTTFLYWNLLKLKVEASPTVGCNTETFEACNMTIQCNDIGGCGMLMHKLVSSYLDGVNGIIFFLNKDTDLSISYLTEFETVNLGNSPILFFCIFDDENDVDSIRKLAHLYLPFIQKFEGRPVTIKFGKSYFDSESSEGHTDIWKWFQNIVKIKPNQKNIKEKEKIQKVVAKKEAENYDWMSTENITIFPSKSDPLTDDEVIEKCESFELPAWDHKTHLRIAYIILTRHGRKEGVGIIMKTIRTYIEKNKYSGKTFHFTMTYFWLHMVHLAMIMNPDTDFFFLIAKNKWLLNGGLFKYFYTDQLMLKNEEIRIEFVVPDKRSLPNILPKNQ